jgi:hypothetical protein
VTARARPRSRSGDRPAAPPNLAPRTRTTRSRTTAPATSSSKRSGKPRELAAVDLSDKAQVKAWALVLEDAIDDMAVAGDEATLPRSDRVLSRAEARQQLFDAWKKALQLLGALQRGAR